jgi:hypothetical protein
MKKPQKAAKKSVPSKKAPPAKKAVAAKPQAKKAVPAKKAAPAPAKKAVPAKKAAPVKASAKKAAPVATSKKAPVAQAKKSNEKVVAKKIAAPVVAPKKVAAPAKKVEAPKKEEKNLKVAPLTKKVEAPKKEEKKLSKKEEKELLKSKGKGKTENSFEDELLEELEKRASEDDEDDFLDDFEKTPAKVKMTFDEVFEEEEIPVRKKKVSIDDDIKENLAEEILALSEDFKIDDIFASIRNMELFKLESDECVVRGCDNPATTGGYCRYHYIKFWKDVKKKEAILTEGRLAKIIEDLVRKYPLKYIESIIQDLADDKAFNHVLKDLDIETDENEIDSFEDDELLDDDQDIAFETKVTKPTFDD